MFSDTELMDYIDILVSPKTSHETRMEMYEKWRHNYTKDVGGRLQNNGPKFTARYLDKHAVAGGLSRDIHILDVACGTGLVGEQLRKLGYTHIDGADACQGMLDESKLTGHYTKLVCCQVGDGHSIPVEEDTYDAVVMCAGFSGGHMKCDALLEMLRVLKKGGLLVNVFREYHIRQDPEYSKLPSLLNTWTQQGLFKILEEDIPPEHYQIGTKEALVHVFQKL